VRWTGWAIGGYFTAFKIIVIAYIVFWKLDLMFLTNPGVAFGSNPPQSQPVSRSKKLRVLLGFICMFPMGDLSYLVHGVSSFHS